MFAYLLIYSFIYLSNYLSIYPLYTHKYMSNTYIYIFNIHINTPDYACTPCDREQAHRPFPNICTKLCVISVTNLSKDVWTCQFALRIHSNLTWLIYKLTSHLIVKNAITIVLLEELKGRNSGTSWTISCAEWYHCSSLRTWLFKAPFSMMMSSNGPISPVTRALQGESTGHRWIPLTKASGA